MAALKYMKPRDRGTIVQVGSALAYRGIPLQTAYCGAKHAIQGFHEALRCELLHDKSNVHVTMVQMPAVNTPQFSWVLSRLPHHAQPVPPIYQPEFAARGVLYAADHPHRREYWVGATTMGTLAANAIAPGLLDRYLGKTGFNSQQTKQRHDPDAPVEPVGAGRRTGRPRLRRPRHLRRQSPPTRSAAVGLAPSRPARRSLAAAAAATAARSSAVGGDHTPTAARATPARRGTPRAGRRAACPPTGRPAPHHGRPRRPAGLARPGPRRAHLAQGVAEAVSPTPTFCGSASSSTSPTPPACSPPRGSGHATAARRWPAPARRRLRRRRRPAGPAATMTASAGPSDRLPPHVLREYALLADGERGAVVGPRGDIVWMCAPRWDSDAVFTALIGGPARYAVTPAGRYVWGGYYEDGSMIWRSRWVTDTGIIECREALAFPGDPHRAVLLRRIIAVDGDAARRPSPWNPAPTTASTR